MSPFLSWPKAGLRSSPGLSTTVRGVYHVFPSSFDVTISSRPLLRYAVRAAEDGHQFAILQADQHREIAAAAYDSDSLYTSPIETRLRLACTLAFNR
jgi:hypothetical protein